MKKSRIFMLSGAALLAISAVFASKANKSFFTFFSIASSATAADYVIKAPTPIFTVSGAAGYIQAEFCIVTSGGSNVAKSGGLKDPANGDAAKVLY